MGKVRLLTHELAENEESRHRIEQRLQQLQRSLGEAEEGKRGADGRLSSAQTALMLQEETIRRNERDRKGMQVCVIIVLAIKYVWSECFQ